RALRRRRGGPADVRDDARLALDLRRRLARSRRALLRRPREGRPAARDDERPPSLERPLPCARAARRRRRRRAPPEAARRAAAARLPRGAMGRRAVEDAGRPHLSSYTTPTEIVSGIEPGTGG